MVLGSSIWVLSIGGRDTLGGGVDLPIGSALGVLTLEAGQLMGTLRWRARPTFWRLLSTGVSQLGLGPFLTVFGSAPSALQCVLLLARTWCLVIIAVVGVIGVHVALLALHSFCTSNSRKFFRLERALTILPLANGGIAHLFVVCWYQGSEVDPHKLAFTNKLMETVPGLAKAGGTGQPVNAEPWVISATSKSLAIGLFC